MNCPAGISAGYFYVLKNYCEGAENGLEYLAIIFSYKMLTGSTSHSM